MENLNFTAIDFETATSDRSSICEIGIACVRDSKIVEHRSWLVRPDGNEYDFFNIYIHHITPDMTKKAPSFSKVWPEVLPYLNDRVVVSHNTAFDMYALRDALSTNNINFPKFNYFCSLRIAKYCLKDCYSYSLPVVCDVLDIPFEERHRAEGDACACAEVFIKCLINISCSSFRRVTNKIQFCLRGI